MPGTALARKPPQWILYAITLVGITIITPLAPVIPDILAAFDAPPTSAGLILGSATLPGIVLAPVIGVLADRFGRRRIIVPCLVLFAVAGSASAFAPGLVSLAVLRFFQGIGASGLINLVVVLIGDHWQGLDRVKMIGRNSAALTAGLAVLPTVGGFMADQWGWRGPFGIYPLVFVIAWFAWRSLPPDTPAVTLSVREQLAASAVVLKTPVVSGLIAMMVILMVAVFGLILTVLPFHLESEYQLSAGQRGIVLGLPSLVSFWIALNAGRITKRFGRGRTVTAGLFVFSASFAVMASPLPLVLFSTSALLWGLAEGLLFPPIQDRVVEAADATSRGTVMAVWVGALRLGQTIGPVAGGLALTQFGARPSFMAGSAMLIAMAFVLWAARHRLA